MKVERALRTGRRVSATAYLKTPRVFGFTGVYKTLGVGLELVTDDVMLDDGGLIEGPSGSLRTKKIRRETAPVARRS